MKTRHFPLLLHFSFHFFHVNHLFLDFMLFGHEFSSSVFSALTRGCLTSWKLLSCIGLQIKFDNHAHSGRIKISLNSDVQIKVCKDWIVSGSSKL